MKTVILLLVVFIAGCSSGSIVVDTKWPSVPTELLKPCADLKMHDIDNDKLSALIDTVGDNYIEYQLCALKTQSWIDWYTAQKEIKENISK